MSGSRESDLAALERLHAEGLDEQLDGVLDALCVAELQGLFCGIGVRQAGPDVVPAAGEGGQDVIGTGKLEVLDLVFVFVAGLLGFLSCRVDLFESEFEDVGEGGGEEGGLGGA